MNIWLLILRDVDGGYLVSAHQTRKMAEGIAAHFRAASILAIVVNLDELVKELTER